MWITYFVVCTNLDFPSSILYVYVVLVETPDDGSLTVCSVARITTSSVCVYAPPLTPHIVQLLCVGMSWTRWAVNLLCPGIIISMEPCK